MCKWNTTKQLEVTIPARLSRTKKERQKIVDVDSCIYDIVETLNKNGFLTDACCCGHGNRPGSIILADGRELIIAKDYEEGRYIDSFFENDIHGKKRGRG